MTAAKRGSSKVNPPIVRNHKGTSLLQAVDNYVVVDIETTGQRLSCDEITELAAVKVKNGIVISEFQSLVKPNSPVKEFIVKKTGITNEMLETAPSMSDVFPRFLTFVGKETIVVHNAHFDIYLVCDACASYSSGAVFDNDFIDTWWLSRRLFPAGYRHRLKDLSRRLGIASEAAHRGLSDALQTYKCYESIRQYAVANNHNFDSLPPLDSGPKEADKTSSKKRVDKSSPVFRKTFVFTGELERMSRKDAEQLIADMGGICGKDVTYKTDYLVLGDNDDCPTVKDGKSGKQKKAEKYMASGISMEIITEEVFYEMVDEYYDQAG